MNLTKLLLVLLVGLTACVFTIEAAAIAAEAAEPAEDDAEETESESSESVESSEEVDEEIQTVNFTNVEAQDEFDVNEFTGTWYHIYRLKWNHHEYQSEVNEVELLDDGSLQSKSSYYDGENCSPVHTMTYTQSKDQPASWFFGTYGGIKVLYTDYNYTVLYICDEVEREGNCNVNKLEVEVMSRVIGPISEEVKANLVAAVESVGLTEDEFERIDNTAITQCSTDEVKSCVVSDYTAMKDFDVEKFTGIWHEIERTRYSESDTWQSGHLKFDNDDEYLYLQYAGTSDGECVGPYKAFGHNYNDILGDFWMHVGESFTDGHPWIYHYSYHIMYTDYENVALMYSCIDKKDDGTCHQHAEQMSILSRTFEVDDDVKAQLYDMISEKTCIDSGDLQAVTMEKHCDVKFGEAFDHVDGSGEEGSGESGDSSGEGSGDEPVPEILIEEPPQPQVLPEVVDEPVVLPEVVDQPQVLPEVVDQPQVLPEVVDQPQVLPEVVDQPQVLPEVVDQPQVLPEVVDQPQVLPEVADEPQTLPEVEE